MLKKTCLSFLVRHFKSKRYLVNNAGGTSYYRWLLFLFTFYVCLMEHSKASMT